MKTTTTGDDGDLHHHPGVLILFPYAFPLEPEGEGEAAAEGGGGGGGPGALDVMQIDEGLDGDDWLLDLLDPLFDAHGDDEDALTSMSTITAEMCIAGDERMLPTEVTDWDQWLLQVQDLTADSHGDDDATTTSTVAEMWVAGGPWEMQIDKGDDAATATTAESRVTGDGHRQPGAGDCGAAGDLPLDWWVPEPTGPPDQLVQGGGVLPDLEAALLLDLIWGTYKY